MKTILGIAILPLICLGVLILTTVVIIFALRRGTKTISEQARQYTEKKPDIADANTRLGRGDLQGETRVKIPEPPKVACPACGGENPAGSSVCAFCGSKM